MDPDGDAKIENDPDPVGVGVGIEQRGLALVGGLVVAVDRPLEPAVGGKTGGRSPLRRSSRFVAMRVRGGGFGRIAAYWTHVFVRHKNRVDPIAESPMMLQYVESKTRIYWQI